MSVVGIDFGNLSLLVGMAGRGGVDVILNESSNRQTATAVSIQGKQRFLGDSGAAMARSNITNTFSCMKLLVGRKFDCPDVQAELKRAPFKASKILPSGSVGINILYNNEVTVVPVEHVMAMMLVKAKEVASRANGNIGVGDSVLAVPHWFTDAQKRAVLHSCEIADLNCLKVADESNLIALSYGIFKSAKKLFSETEPVHIMFIDIGYTGYSVSVVDFMQENMKVLSTVNDRALGGRDFDDVIIEYLCETFQKKTGIDVRGNMKAWLKLQVAAEKAKKTLSPAGVNEAAVSVECLADDKDLSCTLTRDEFEKRTSDLINRLEAPVLKCLEESGLKCSDISEVEIVGGSSRINAVKRKLGEVMGLDPSALNFGLKTTMNSDEAVARGGALQAAMLSSRMRVKPFAMVDKMPYGIVVKYTDAVDGNMTTTTTSQGMTDDVAEEKDDTKKLGHSISSEGIHTQSLWERGSDLPSGSGKKRMDFKNRTGDFVVTICYDDAAEEFLPTGEDKQIGKYTIKVPPELVAAGPQSVRVIFQLDKHALLIVAGAELMQEIPSVDQHNDVATAASATVVNANTNENNKMTDETQEKTSSSTGGEEKMDVTEGEKEEKEIAATAATSAAPEEKKKKTRQFTKVPLTVVSDVFGLTKEQVKNSIELEASMAYEDRLITETADKRNELEAYIYSMRDKLDGIYKPYGTDIEKNHMQTKMTEAEDWLYGDGFDSTKQQYAKKIEDLRMLGDPIESRMVEEQARGPAVENLQKQISKCKNFLSNYEDIYAHITDDERDVLRAEVAKTDAWLQQETGKQSKLATYDTPMLTAAILSQRRADLIKFATPIMNKPKPAPAPVPVPPAAQPAEEKKASDAPTDKSSDDDAHGKQDSAHDSNGDKAMGENKDGDEKDLTDISKENDTDTSVPMET